jgi:hypothetical protein
MYDAGEGDIGCESKENSYWHNLLVAWAFHDPWATLVELSVVFDPFGISPSGSGKITLFDLLAWHAQ